MSQCHNVIMPQCHRTIVALSYDLVNDICWVISYELLETVVVVAMLRTPPTLLALIK